MITLPLNLPAGVSEIPETDIGQATAIEVALARAVTADPTQWANAETAVTVDLQVSSDGLSYESGGSFSASGGIHTDKSGVESPLTVVVFHYPRILTHVKGTITVANGPLVTILTLAGH